MSRSEYQANLDLQRSNIIANKRECKVKPDHIVVCENCGSDHLGAPHRGDELRAGYDAHCFDCDRPTFKTIQWVSHE